MGGKQEDRMMLRYDSGEWYAVRAEDKSLSVGVAVGRENARRYRKHRANWIEYNDKTFIYQNGGRIFEICYRIGLFVTLS